MADSQVVLAALVRARSTSLLHSAYLLTGDQAAAERLLEDALLAVRRRHPKVDPYEVEAEVRTAMVRKAGRGGRAARTRVVVALTRFEGLTPPEIACMLGCSTGTVTSDLARADSVTVGAPDDMTASDEWRVEVTDELGTPIPEPTDWATLGVVLAAAVIAAWFVLAILHDDGASEPLPVPPSYGNAAVIRDMAEGHRPQIDLLDSQGMLRTPSSAAVPVGTFTTVLGRSPRRLGGGLSLRRLRGRAH